MTSGQLLSTGQRTVKIRANYSRWAGTRPFRYFVPISIPSLSRAKEERMPPSLLVEKSVRNLRL